jgi:hypothetical protein
VKNPKTLAWTEMPLLLLLLLLLLVLLLLVLLLTGEICKCCQPCYCCSLRYIAHEVEALVCTPTTITAEVYTAILCEARAWGLQFQGMTPRDLTKHLL